MRGGQLCEWGEGGCTVARTLDEIEPKYNPSRMLLFRSANVKYFHCFFAFCRRSLFFLFLFVGSRFSCDGLGSCLLLLFSACRINCLPVISWAAPARVIIRHARPRAYVLQKLDKVSAPRAFEASRTALIVPLSFRNISQNRIHVHSAYHYTCACTRSLGRSVTSDKLQYPTVTRTVLQTGNTSMKRMFA